MSLQQVDQGTDFNVTEITPAAFRALTLQQLCTYDLIAINNNPSRIDCGSGLGLGTTWHALIGVNQGGRVHLNSHDAARFKIIIPPGGAFGGAGAPGPGVEPFGADEIVRQAALWTGGGTRTGLLIFNDSARFGTVLGVGWNNPELNLPAPWAISDLDQTGGNFADGGYTDILPAFAAHPIYAGLSDTRFGVDTLASFAANIGDGSFHSIFATFNPGIFTPTERVINAGVIDVGGFNAAFGIGANVSPNGPDGAVISLIRDETFSPDCNNNGCPDDTDIAAGISQDTNNNGVPDECEAANPPDRVSGTEKGSVLIFSKVEIRWDAAGNVVQDTFLDITNDWAQPVGVQMYFVNGDPPLDADGTERAHPGWNSVNVKVGLTGNQPAYWSALTGQPGPGGAGVSPFTILDPSPDPLAQGRPAPDGSGERVLRGFVYAWACDLGGCQVAFDHLKGDAILVNYGGGYAWEYNAWAFQAVGLVGDEPVPPFVQVGAVCGEINLDGTDYVAPYSMLLLDFYASPGAGAPVGTDLTLHPVDIDLRQDNVGPLTTKATFVIWNENETQFTGLHRCITCWDQALLSQYVEAGNHFLIGNLQTDKGKAQIDGLVSTLCSSNCCIARPAGGGNNPGCASVDCQELVCQVMPACCTTAWDETCVSIAVDLCDECDGLNLPAPLLGVQAKLGGNLAAGGNLVGMGTEPTGIFYDPVPGGPGPPPSIGAAPAPREHATRTTRTTKESLRR
jgi:hypothetical protein